MVPTPKAKTAALPTAERCLTTVAIESMCESYDQPNINEQPQGVFANFDARMNSHSEESNKRDVDFLCGDEHCLCVSASQRLTASLFLTQRRRDAEKTPDFLKARRFSSPVFFSNLNASHACHAFGQAGRVPHIFPQCAGKRAVPAFA